jgi:CRISPR/Cas system CSM-associated protein Csm2 small subunit
MRKTARQTAEVANEVFIIAVEFGKENGRKKDRTSGFYEDSHSCLSKINNRVNSDFSDYLS